MKNYCEIKTEHYILGVQKRVTLDNKTVWNIRGKRIDDSSKESWEDWFPISIFEKKKEAQAYLNYLAAHAYK
jgi:hypothetical protein